MIWQSYSGQSDLTTSWGQNDESLLSGRTEFLKTRGEKIEGGGNPNFHLQAGGEPTPLDTMCSSKYQDLKLGQCLDIDYIRLPSKLGGLMPPSLLFITCSVFFYTVFFFYTDHSVK